MQTVLKFWFQQLSNDRQEHPNSQHSPENMHIPAANTSALTHTHTHTHTCTCNVTSDQYANFHYTNLHVRFGGCSLLTLLLKMERSTQCASRTPYVFMAELQNCRMNTDVKIIQIGYMGIWQARASKHQIKMLFFFSLVLLVLMALLLCVARAFIHSSVLVWMERIIYGIAAFFCCCCWRVCVCFCFQL